MKNWIKQAEKLLATGQGSLVRAELKKVQKKGVDGDSLLPVARIARRTGMYQYATNLLFRLINENIDKASPEVIAEYASSCAGVGNHVEAKELFDKINESDLQDYLIIYADSLFRTWEYDKARSVLLRNKPQSFESYQDLVYGLNLCSALLTCENYDQFSEFIEEILFIAKKRGHNVILANCLEMKGQKFFLDDRLEEAISLFKESEELLKISNNISWLFSNKWRVITELKYRKSNSRVVAEQLSEVRMQARTFLHWETLRECDLYESILTKNEDLFNRAYFGTPNKYFRERALKLTESQFHLDSNIPIGGDDSGNLIIFDMKKGNFTDERLQLNLSDSMKAVLVTLFSDIYSPRSLYELFRSGYGETHFDPESSKEKTYKLLKRLRNIIAKHPSGLNMTNRRGYGYRLRAQSRVTIKYLHLHSLPHFDPLDEYKEILFSKFGTREFKAQEFAQITKKPPRSAARILVKLCSEAGPIEKLGSGSKTRYRLKAI